MSFLKQKHLKYFEVLASEERIKMLGLLSKREMSVQQINGHFFASQPTISYHLSLLKKIGFVTCRKVGKNMYYSFNADKAKKYLAAFVEDLISAKVFA